MRTGRPRGGRSRKPADVLASPLATLRQKRRRTRMRRKTRSSYSGGYFSPRGPPSLHVSTCTSSPALRPARKRRQAVSVTRSRRRTPRIVPSARSTRRTRKPNVCPSQTLPAPSARPRSSSASGSGSKIDRLELVGRDAAAAISASISRRRIRRGALVSTRRCRRARCRVALFTRMGVGTTAPPFLARVLSQMRASHAVNVRRAVTCALGRPSSAAASVPAMRSAASCAAVRPTCA